MPRIGVTGHVALADGTAPLVYDCLVRHLRGHAGPELHGITCLAEGSDQLFARAVLAVHGTYEVVLPAADYRERVSDRDAFDELVRRASAVSCMPYEHSGRDAYLAASEELLRRSELLLAVWDGNPSTVRGDTADVVRTAHEWGVPVTVLWPPGARRA